MEIFPYVASWSVGNFINTVPVAIAIESGLAVIGLSSRQQPPLGTTIYWRSIPGAPRRAVVVDTSPR